MNAQSARTQRCHSTKGRSGITTEEDGSLPGMLAVMLDHLQTEVQVPNCRWSSAKRSTSAFTVRDYPPLAAKRALRSLAFCTSTSTTFRDSAHTTTISANDQTKSNTMAPKTNPKGTYVQAQIVPVYASLRNACCPQHTIWHCWHHYLSLIHISEPTRPY